MFTGHTQHATTPKILQDAPVQATASQEAAQLPDDTQPDSVMAEAGSGAPTAVEADAPASTNDVLLDTIATESAPEASQVSLYVLSATRCLLAVLSKLDAAGGSCWRFSCCSSNREQ